MEHVHENETMEFWLNQYQEGSKDTLIVAEFLEHKWKNPYLTLMAIFTAIRIHQISRM